MFESSAQFRCCAAYLRSSAALQRPSSASTADRMSAAPQLHVLIVEFRGEVFTSLKSLFEEHGCEVSRAATGANVADQTERVAPDLLLINENMPDESGWLITYKLRLTRVRQPVWLYAVRAPRIFADWKEFSGADEVIAHGGVLSRLILRVGERLEHWLDCSSVVHERKIHAGGTAA